MIYFVACPEANAVKIGHTGEATPGLYKRVSMLQTACPLRLELIGTQLGQREEERALHAKFSSARIHGEWFRFTEEIRDHCATLFLPVRPPRSARAEKVSRKWALAA